MDYNYPAFSFEFDAPGIEAWLRDGPKPGERAPSFELPALDGGTVGLDGLLGQPVVIEFGSYTCPIFCGHVPPMDELARRYPQVSWLVIYTREAHPGETTPEHRSLDDKRAAARLLAADEAIKRRVLIDDLEGLVHRRYGGAWDSVYVIGADGRVVLREAWTHPDRVDEVLGELTSGQDVRPRETRDMAPPSGQPFGEGLLRGGKRALRDFWETAPPPVQQRLSESPSQLVRDALAEILH
jgi:peroxiredoxin